MAVRPIAHALLCRAVPRLAMWCIAMQPGRWYAGLNPRGQDRNGQCDDLLSCEGRHFSDHARSASPHNGQEYDSPEPRGQSHSSSL